MDINLLNSLENTLGYGRDRFYNPKVACLGFSVSITKPSFQLEIAKSINPQADPKNLPKDQSIYDYKNAAFFSLTPIECKELAMAFNAVYTGEYVDHSEKNEKYKNAYKITHYANNKPSTLSFRKTEYGLSVTILANSQTHGYTLRASEAAVFYAFLEKCANELYFYKAILRGGLKMMKQGLFNNDNPKQPRSNGSAPSDEAEQDSPPQGNQFGGGSYTQDPFSSSSNKSISF